MTPVTRGAANNTLQDDRTCKRVQHSVMTSTSSAVSLRALSTLPINVSSIGLALTAEASAMVRSTRTCSVSVTPVSMAVIGASSMVSTGGSSEDPQQPMAWSPGLELLPS